MATRNVTVAGATYNSVPSVELPTSGGGTASFVEITDTTATASDVASGKYFYTAAGVKTAGTNSGGITPSGVIPITNTGTYDVDVTNYATASVYIPLQSQSWSFTPAETTQTKSIEPDTGYKGLNGVLITVNPIPSQYIVPSGSTSITTNGSHDVTAYETAVVDVPATIENKLSAEQSSTTTTITFTGLTKQPKMWACQLSMSSGSYISGATTRYLTSLLCLGSTNIYSTCIYKSGSTAREYQYTTCTWTYSSGSLTITSPGTSTAGGFATGQKYRIFCAY